MINISFIKLDPLNVESAVDIAWHNIEIADQNLNLKVFIGASLGWLKANPDKNYQDLEKELRERNFNTHLIAINNPNIPNTKLQLPNSDVLAEYQCIMSCRPPKDAVTELLQHSKSYEENFDKLKLSGNLYSNKDEEDNMKNNNDVVILDKDEQTDMEKMANNELKVRIEKIDSMKFIKKIETDLRSIYPNVTSAVVGMANDGSPIFAFVLDNEIISQYGFSITATEDGNITNVVTFQQ